MTHEDNGQGSSVGVPTFGTQARGYNRDQVDQLNRRFSAYGKCVAQ